MNTIKKVFDWIMFSSVNSNSVSLTLKGLVPFLVLLHFSNTTSLNETADVVVNSLVLLGTAISATIAAYGGLRKVVLTLSDLLQSKR